MALLAVGQAEAAFEKVANLRMKGKHKSG
jgi:hypothetical protein